MFLESLDSRGASVWATPVEGGAAPLLPVGGVKGGGYWFTFATEGWQVRYIIGFSKNRKGSPVSDISLLLRNFAGGDASAYEAIYSGIQAELRRLAASAMRRERPDHTLQPTALVNEAWIRLVASPVSWEGRAEFLRASARIMREILVDHARSRGRVKRGGDLQRVELQDSISLALLDPEKLISLDAALEKLNALDPRSRQIVELRYFAGLSREETAQVMDLSLKTVTRDWNFARAWLEKELRG